MTAAPQAILPVARAPSDLPLRASALANAGLAVASLAAHLAEQEALDAEEAAEQLLTAGLQVLLTRRHPADARILAEISRWVEATDEPSAAAPAATDLPVRAEPWTWLATTDGDLILLDEADRQVAQIQAYRLPVLEAADPEAEQPYTGAWIATVTPPGDPPACQPWRLTCTSLPDAYARVERALGRNTAHWRHPAAAMGEG